MKRAFAFIFAFCMTLSMTACKNKSGGNGYNGPLPDLMDMIYKEPTTESGLGPTEEINLNDNGAVNYFLGLETGELLQEAVFSESITSGRPYSVCLARVKSSNDTEAVKQMIFKNIDPNKWGSAEADQVRVAASGNVILLVMIGDDPDTGLADRLVAAFEQITGGLSGQTLAKG